MRSFRVPEILLLIPPQHFAIVIDEVGSVHKLGFPCLRVGVRFDDRAGDNADFAFAGEGSILVEISAPVVADGEEGGGVGEPICKGVFREDGEGGATVGGGADEGCCFGEIEGGGQRLWVELDQGDFVGWRHTCGIQEIL